MVQRHGTSDPRPGAQGASPARVVIVEDHPLFADSVRLVLERTGQFTVVGIAGSAQEAIDLIVRARPDIAIVDVRLPRNGEGIHVAQAVSAQVPSTQIMMLTGSDDPEHVRSSLQLRVSGFLSKDLRITQLPDAVACIRDGLCVLTKEALGALVDRPSSPSPLSPEQYRLLTLIAAGRSREEIVKETASSSSKFNRELARIGRLLEVDSRVEAVVKAVREGWI